MLINCRSPAKSGSVEPLPTLELSSKIRALGKASPRFASSLISSLSSATAARQMYLEEISAKGNSPLAYLMAQNRAWCSSCEYGEDATQR